MNNQIPSNIKIGGRVYSVIITNHNNILNENPDAQAYVNHQDREIVIRDVGNIEHKKEYMLHEILHALIDDTGVEFEQHKTIETIVSVLTPRLMALFKDNKDLWL